MSLSNQARTRRNVELRSKEDAISALYFEQKSDEEIAAILHIDEPLIRATRDSMGLPPLRSASGRLFTPDVDTKLMELRDEKGVSFPEIARLLGHLPMDIEVRWRILTRLENRAPTRAKAATIPCKVCRQPFNSADRTRIRFCLPCRTNVVPGLDGSPYDHESSGGAYSCGLGPLGDL